MADAEELAQLATEVAAQGTVVASATAAFQGLAGQLAVAETAARNAGATDAQVYRLAALRRSLVAATPALATAILANTIAASEMISPQPAAPAPAANTAAAIQSTALAEP